MTDSATPGVTVDLQVHTRVSPCSLADPEAVVHAAVESGLDAIAITDHDTVGGVAAVQKAAPATLQVIPGVEVSTTQGHLIGLDVTEAPEPSSPQTVIESIHDQGGIAILSHPFDRLRQRYDTNLSAIASAVDAIEGINSRCLDPRGNSRATAFSDANDLPVVGGSDAHFPFEIGRAYTVCSGSPLESIRRGQTRAVGRGNYFSGHLATKIAQVHRFITDG